MDKVKIAIQRGYFADEFSQIRNKDGEIILGTISSGGYRVFTIRVESINLKILAHRMVAYRKYGERMFEPGVCVRHLNSNKTDNSTDNIAIGTHTDNMNDKSKEVRVTAAKHAASFLKKYDYQKMKEYYLINGHKKTMQAFGIKSKGTMSYIYNHW